MALQETVHDNLHGMVQSQWLGTKDELTPPSVRRMDYFWDAANLAIVILEHICVLAAPSHFTWHAFWVCVVLSVLCGPIGIGLCYHRSLCHRSLKLNKSVEYLFAYFGLHAAQGDPIYWVSVHRFHHQFVDTLKDPHSPIEGFWFSYINWIFQHTYLREKHSDHVFAVRKTNNVMDLKKQAYYRFLRKTISFHYVGLALLLYVTGGLPHFIWGMGVRMAYSHHGTFIINSVCHMWGKRPYNTKDLSRNNWLMNILNLSGEGWHNNHHAFEFSARLGLEWWQLDFPWYVIKLLESIGLATDVKVPTEIQKLQMSSKNQ
ncbi:hypothetical protein C5167_008268 [Papaver somniferum]|uniref:Fatty acid desaturase domain-containing protein n=1 Tax=Papaver somniferum TaxID=3469 RepID=A0A4Y7JV42_PAPSO|nr:hypothetical protein C5167_008268 [Papaver somniferum]